MDYILDNNDDDENKILRDNIVNAAERIMCDCDFGSKQEIENFIELLENYLYHLYADEDNDIVDPNDSDYTDDSD